MLDIKSNLKVDIKSQFNDNSKEYKGAQNQIFSQDEISFREDILIENNSLPNKNWENDSIIIEDIFDNLNFLEKIEINEENIGDIVKLKNRTKKIAKSNEYINKLLKKLSFLNNQLDFLKTHYQSTIVKSSILIENFETNNSTLFN